MDVSEQLYTMSRDGNLEGVKILLQSGVDPNIMSNNNKSACWIATYRRRNDILRLLLEHGASPNIKNSEGIAPLYFAIAFQNFEAVKLLVDHGADTTTSDNKGHTPLYYAQNNECEDIISYVQGNNHLSE